MNEALEILVVVAGGAVYAVMLIVPVVEHAAMMRELDGVIRGGWLVSEAGQQVVCHTRCQAPDMKIYRENWRQRRRGHGF